MAPVSLTQRDGGASVPSTGKKYHVGYTQGAFDMFHVGHLNLIEAAKRACDVLVVGVNADELVKRYKHKTPVINEEDRCRIVSALKGVDEAYVVNTLDKLDIYKLRHFDAVFIGTDWQGSERWQRTERELAPLGVDVVYLPHTDGVSSTELRPVASERVDDLREE